MKKNLYYRTVLRRRNLLYENLLAIFLSLSAIFRVFIENIIRRSMGERYFSYVGSIIICWILVIYPIVITGLVGIFFSLSKVDWETLFKQYTTWYAYTWFLIKCTKKRRQEVLREPSVFDFKRFSLSGGYLEEFYIQFIPKKILLNPRKCDIIGEPLPFFIVGLLLMIMSQPLGYIFVVSSIIYSISYVAAYYNGDNLVMDMIDEIILNEEMESSFVGDEEMSQNRGVQFFMRKPNGEELRRKTVDSFFEVSDPKEATLMQ